MLKGMKGEEEQAESTQSQARTESHLQMVLVDLLDRPVICFLPLEEEGCPRQA